MNTERRTQRSNDPIEAAELYLKSAAERKSFTALALANTNGAVVAEAPSSINSQALAAVAPFVETDAELVDGLLRLVTRGDELRVWGMEIGGEHHYLTAVGGEESPLNEAENTLKRILKD